MTELAKQIDRDLRAIRQILRRPVEAEVSRGGLTGPQQSAMHLLIQGGGLTLKELSREMGLAHSTVSGIVDRLARQGLVQRHPDATDGRATRLTVTRRVSRYLRDVFPSLELHPIAEALRDAKTADREAIHHGVRTLRRILESRPDSAALTSPTERKEKAVR